MDEAKRKWYSDKLMMMAYQLEKAKYKKQIASLAISIIALGQLFEMEDIWDE